MRGFQKLLRLRPFCLRSLKTVLPAVGTWLVLRDHFRVAHASRFQTGCEVHSDFAALGIPNAIPLFDLEDVEALLQDEEQEFHLVVSASASPQDLERAAKEVDLACQFDRRSLNVFVYICRDERDFAAVKTKLTSNASLVRLMETPRAAVVSKRLLRRKPLIFCGNNRKIQTKLHEYLSARGVDKFSAFVFFSSHSSSKAVLEKVTELKRKYPGLTFVDSSALGWTSRAASNKIVLIRKKSKYLSLPSEAEFERSAKTQVKEFSRGGHTYQWVPVHSSGDSIDAVMDRFCVFSPGKAPWEWSEKHIEVKVTVNRNKLSTREFHRLLEMLRETKQAALESRPKVFFTLRFSSRLDPKVQISAENLHEKRIRKKIFEIQHKPSADETELLKDLFWNFKRYYRYLLDSELRYMRALHLKRFVDQVSLGTAKELKPTEKPKPLSRVQRIGYNDFLRLGEGGADSDSFVCVYSNDCPTCNTLKPIVFDLSMRRSGEGSFSAVRFLKLNAQKNFGFYVYPKFFFVKGDSGERFELFRSMNRKNASKNMGDFISVLSEVQMQPRTALGTFEALPFRGEVDLARLLQHFESSTAPG